MASSLISIVLLSSLAQAWDQRENLPIGSCSDELPYGVPVSGVENKTLRCLEGYALEHDNDARISSWVAYTLSPEESLGCFPRTNVFAPDNSLQKEFRAETADYYKSGYDQGHLAPDGDMSWDQQVEYESFLLSNMSPQYPNVNRGAWKLLETFVRSWAWEKKHSYLVYAGNIYSQSSKTIGKNKVIVPDKLYKISVDQETREVWGFIFPNMGKLESSDPKKYLVSVQNIEAQTGISFPLPPGTDKTLLKVDLPPANLKGLLSAKKEACKKGTP